MASPEMLRLPYLEMETKPGPFDKILWRIDPAYLKRIPEERMREILRISLAAQAEISTHIAAINAAEAKVFNELAAKI